MTCDRILGLLEEYVRWTYRESNYRVAIYSNLLWTVSIYTLCPGLIINIYSFVLKSIPMVL